MEAENEWVGGAEMTDNPKENAKLQKRIAELELDLRLAEGARDYANDVLAYAKEQNEAERQRREEAEAALRDYRTNGTWLLGRTPPDVAYFSRYLNTQKW